MGSFGKTQALNKHQIRKMEVARDERGFDKADMQVMDPRQANFQETVNLVERDTCPDGFQLVNPQESGKKTQFDLVELAGAIQTADKFTRATAGSKLSVIAEQVRFLQEQARKVLEEAQRDAEINHMACNFKRIPGKVYYIYKRKNGQQYMSLISPEEWGADGPEFVASYKLNVDHSWTPIDDVERKDDENAKIDKIIRTHQSASNHLQLTFI